MTTINRTAGFFNQERETATPEQWRAYHDQQVREICSLAYERAPAVKAIFAAAGLEAADIKGVEDLAKIPVTSKSRLAELQAENPPFGGFLTVPVHELKRIFMSPGPIYDPQGREADFWGWARGCW